MGRYLKTIISSLLVSIGLTTGAIAEQNYVGGTGRWTTPLLVCWQAERLIAALQPGVQGLPEHCTTLPPPQTFQINSLVWSTVLPYNGVPYDVGVYQISIVGRAGEFYTVLGTPQ